MKTLMTSISIMIFFILPISAHSAKPKNSEPDQNWYIVGADTQNNLSYSIKKGSFEITETEDGIPIVIAIGQTVDKKANRVIFNKWYVSLDDCDSGFGKLVVLTVSGDFDFDIDYVSGGRSVGSIIGDFVCAYHKESVRRSNNI